MRTPARSLLVHAAVVAAVLVPSPAPAAGDLVYVALGERTPPGARSGDQDRIAGRLAAGRARIRRVDLTAPGLRAEDVRRTSLAPALALRPKVVTLAIGAADACGTTELRRFARDLHVVTELLRRNSGVVVLSTMATPEGPCSRSGPALRRRVAAFNAVIARAASQNGVLLAQVRPDGEGPESPWEAAVAAELENALSPAAHASEARRRPGG